MNKYIISALTLIALLSAACTKSGPQENATESEETIVIDGWIENGNNPMVFVTTAVPTTLKKQQISDLANHIVRYAKATIEHDGVVYPLTACLSDYYYIQAYFTTTDLYGEVGGEYKLRVEYNGQTVEATTTIPEPAVLDSLWSFDASIQPYKTVRCSFHDRPEEENYYRFFTLITNRQKHYTPSYMGLMDDSAAGDVISIDVDAGSELPNIGEYVRYYSGDIVSIKFATMTKESYKFWSKVDQNNIIAFFPINVAGVNVYGNIEGGLGCWAGYGINEYTICVK